MTIPKPPTKPTEGSGPMLSSESKESDRIAREFLGDHGLSVPRLTADLALLLAEIVAEEREACAAIAEAKAARAEHDDQINGEACLDIASDIRARGGR